MEHSLEPFLVTRRFLLSVCVENGNESSEPLLLILLASGRRHGIGLGGARPSPVQPSPVGPAGAEGRSLAGHLNTLHHLSSLPLPPSTSGLASTW